MAPYRLIERAGSRFAPRKPGLPPPRRAHRHPALRALALRREDRGASRDPQSHRAGDGGALVRGHARPSRTRPLVLRHRPARRRAPGRLDRSPHAGPDQRQRRPGDPRSAIRPTRRAAMARTRSGRCSASGSASCASSGSGSTCTTTTPAAATSTSASGSSRKRRSGAASSATAGYIDVHRMAMLRDEWSAAAGRG